MKLLLRYSIAALLIHYSGLLHADYKADIGHTQLANELGASLPKGSNIRVSQSEADTDGVAGAPYKAIPDINDSRFTGKTINSITANNNIISGHATSVGSYFYGNTGMASSITQIDAYEANGWMSNNYLYYGTGWQPLLVPNRIANHSWVANIPDLAVATELLRRIDWVVETDEFLQFVGVRNNLATNMNLFSAAYNTIAVGKINGIHGISSPTVDSIYVAGRTRTEIVAPISTSSAATPIVAATAGLLVETGHSNPGLSNGSTSNRNGDTIYNAERSETIRAALLAGADRYTKNLTPNSPDPVDPNNAPPIITNITDYRSTGNQSVNGLDSRYGAGQVNAYHSYHIIAAGEQNSLEDGGAGSIAPYGFDYDPAFGGGNGSNNVASYPFSTSANPQIFTASLVWNLDIDGGRRTSFNQAATFHDLDLYLYDVTAGKTPLMSSTSLIDNSENIWISLAANRNYLLEVVPKSASFNWDYALAWKLASDLDADGIADNQDNCPANANADQADMDNDTIGDACDNDIDGDGTPNATDAFPLDPTETADTDSDGIGNNTDTDDDNDGLLDTIEISIGTNQLLIDTDGDSFSDFDEVNAGSDPLDINSTPVTADGDLNNDGIVNILDILLGQQILAGIIPLTADHLSHGDVAPLVSGTPSPNGIFNVGDLVVIQRKALGLITF